MYLYFPCGKIAYNVYCFQYYISTSQSRETLLVAGGIHSIILGSCVSEIDLGMLKLKESGLMWGTCLVQTLVFWSCLVHGVLMKCMICVNEELSTYQFSLLHTSDVPMLKSVKSYQAVAKERPLCIQCSDALPESHQIKSHRRLVWNVTVVQRRTSKMVTYYLILSTCILHIYYCKITGHKT